MFDFKVINSISLRDLRVLKIYCVSFGIDFLTNWGLLSTSFKLIIILENVEQIFSYLIDEEL